MLCCCSLKQTVGEMKCAGPRIAYPTALSTVSRGGVLMAPSLTAPPYSEEPDQQVQKQSEGLNPPPYADPSQSPLAESTAARTTVSQCDEAGALALPPPYSQSALSAPTLTTQIEPAPPTLPVTSTSATPDEGTIPAISERSDLNTVDPDSRAVAINMTPTGPKY